MKVIVAGSRTIEDYDLVEKIIFKSGFKITEIVSGDCKGVDRLALDYAKKHHIKTKLFPAIWAKLGKTAGLKRNYDMANYADALIAIWDGTSLGTGDMIRKAKNRGLEIFIYNTKYENL